MGKDRGKTIFLRELVVCIGLAVNVGLAYMVQRFGVPLYMDTVGTIGVSVICGTFPGVFVAVATNALCSIFNGATIYFSILHILVAICAARFGKRKSLSDGWGILGLILQAALISGVFGSFLQWLLFGRPQYAVVADTVDAMVETTGWSAFVVFCILNFFLNVVDKGIAVIVAVLVLYPVPEERRRALYYVAWRQAPMTDGEIRKLSVSGERTRRSLQGRVTILLLVISLSIVAVVGCIAVRIYYMDTKEKDIQIAWSTVKFAAEVVDPDAVDRFASGGRRSPGYADMEDRLYRIRKNAPDVTYLYVLRIMDDGCQFIFDVATDHEEALNNPGAVNFEPGEFVEFEEAFEPYLPDLFAGRPVGPIESNGIWDQVITVYYPVLDDAGHCVCYVGADVSLAYIKNAMEGYAFKVFLIMLGFLVMIIFFGVWQTRVLLTYPIKGLTFFINGFMRRIEDGEDVASLKEGVEQIRRLDVHTGDEIENLYMSLLTLSENVTDQIWEIRHYSEAVTKMQNGLIMTMADMVENRDADTGAHIMKTAEYVRIIVDGLKRKGYYADKMTQKYMSDVIMSAPLHDVGKIKIPDAILNKPGKLTPEEYEIMKTHTTAGRIILEKAISTASGDNYLKEARNMAAYHHEKWNGKGYPEGLYGEVIPLSARIMAVADVFDALSSRRIYKAPMPVEKVFEIIEEGSGKDFDPKCVEVFLESIDKVKQVMRKYKEYEG